MIYKLTHQYIQSESILTPNSIYYTNVVGYFSSIKKALEEHDVMMTDYIGMTVISKFIEEIELDSLYFSDLCTTNFYDENNNLIKRINPYIFSGYQELDLNIGDFVLYHPLDNDRCKLGIVSSLPQTIHNYDPEHPTLDYEILIGDDPDNIIVTDKHITKFNLDEFQLNNRHYVTSNRNINYERFVLESRLEYHQLNSL